MDRSTAVTTLKKWWGYDSFKPMQEKIINNILIGRDTVGLLPTGGGKSITFQVPTMMNPGMCLVISPLIALMRDQVKHLRDRGIKATGIYYGTKEEEMKGRSKACENGEYKFLYISPERFEKEVMQDSIKKMNIRLIVVDEAHCISSWGYDFRPSYLGLCKLREIIPNIPIMALTATANDQVQKDIIQNLQITGAQIFRSSFKRTNLEYVVHKTELKMTTLMEEVTQVKDGCTIIYVRNRVRTETLANYLKSNGLIAEYYHAGMEFRERRRVQRKWNKNKIDVMVSTNAFGMGIDKDNVRLIIHMDIPESIESYFQEIGRAGRDGKPSKCVLIYNREDYNTVYHKGIRGVPTLNDVNKVLSYLVRYQHKKEVKPGETVEFNLSHFANKYTLNYDLAHNALKMIERDGWIQITQSGYQPSKIRIKSTKGELARYEINSNYVKTLIRYISLNKSGAFKNYITIKESDIARAINETTEEVTRQLNYLDKKGHIQYEENSDTPTITFLRPIIYGKSKVRGTKEIIERCDYLSKRIRALIDYVNTTTECRSVIMLKYFGDKSEPCGNCDICEEINSTIEILEEEYGSR